jgi:hypothetical protein
MLGAARIPLYGGGAWGAERLAGFLDRFANLRTVRHLFDWREGADFTQGVRHGFRTSLVPPPARPPPSSQHDVTEEADAMKPIGTFYPIPGEADDVPAVLFAYVVDTPDQQRALREEAVARLTAVTSLSDALLTMKVEDHEERSHVRTMEAIAILARDAKALIQAAAKSSD